MEDFSVLTGGKAGSGIDKATLILGHLLNQSGYRIYIYHDYPSLIRGGHTFSIIRATQTRIAAHRDNCCGKVYKEDDSADCKTVGRREAC